MKKITEIHLIFVNHLVGGTQTIKIIASKPILLTEASEVVKSEMKKLTKEKLSDLLKVDFIFER